MTQFPAPTGIISAPNTPRTRRPPGSPARWRPPAGSTIWCWAHRSPQASARLRSTRGRCGVHTLVSTHGNRPQPPCGRRRPPAWRSCVSTAFVPTLIYSPRIHRRVCALVSSGHGRLCPRPSCCPQRSPLPSTPNCCVATAGQDSCWPTLDESIVRPGAAATAENRFRKHTTVLFCSRSANSSPARTSLLGPFGVVDLRFNA